MSNPLEAHLLEAFRAVAAERTAGYEGQDEASTEFAEFVANQLKGRHYDVFGDTENAQQ